MRIGPIKAFRGACRARFAPPESINLVCVGNSLTESIAAYSYPNLINGLFGGNSFVVTNLGVGGSTTPQLSARAASTVDVLFDSSYWRNIVIMWEGGNDIRYGASAAEAAQNIEDYCLARRAAGWTVITGTILPRETGVEPPTYEVDRLAANVTICADWSTYCDALADVAADSRIGDYADVLVSTYYSDQLHLNDAGQEIVAGIMKGAIWQV